MPNKVQVRFFHKKDNVLLVSWSSMDHLLLEQQPNTQCGDATHPPLDVSARIMNCSEVQSCRDKIHVLAHKESFTLHTDQ